MGSVFLSVVATNPASLLGYGTWAAFGAGRMLVGLDSGQAAFDTAEETGGALTHGHTSTQPTIGAEAAHTHAYTQVPNHVHPLATGSGASGNFSQVIGTVDTTSGGTGGTPTQTALGTLSANPSGGVASGTSAAGSSHAHTATNASVADGSTLPPYIVVRFWKRTA